MIKVFKLRKKHNSYPLREYFTGVVDGNIVKVYITDNQFEVFRLSKVEHYAGQLPEHMIAGRRGFPLLLLDHFDIVDVRYAANKHNLYTQFRLKYYNKERFDEYFQESMRKYNEEMKNIGF